MSDNQKKGTTDPSVNLDVFKQLKDLDKEKLLWLSGYFRGQANLADQLSNTLLEAAGMTSKDMAMPESTSPTVSAPETPTAPIAEKAPEAATAVEEQPKKVKELTILYGSHSGNGKSVANNAKALAEAENFNVDLHDMAKFRARDIKNLKNVLVIVSTHGEGEPPSAAEELYEYILGKKAPKLDGLNYTVLALGDKSYVQFCKIGVDFDEKLHDLGANRFLARTDCDVEFEEDAEKWLNNAVQKLNELYGASVYSGGASVKPVDAAKEKPKKFNQNHPFPAEVLTKINLNGKGSLKETYHVELDISGSGITYKPGDSVGVLANNPRRLVDELLETTRFNGNENVYLGSMGYTLRNALTNHLETTVLTVDTIKKHNLFAKSDQLDKLLTDPKLLSEFLYGRDFVDLIKEFPVIYSPQELVDNLRKLPARLYSISSSPSLYEDEIHLTVGSVRYKANGRYKEGAASSFLSDRIEEEQKIPVYIKPNEGFRLPEDPKKKIIMVGPGTGIAPFRAFVDERAESGNPGNSWLFFGNPHFTTDFLYQTEWLEHIKNETLTRLNVAFSRDQKDKVYVQHKIKQHGKDLYSWLNDDAHIYVCGDKNRMAKDVENAFAGILQEYGNKSAEDAAQFLKTMKREGKYQEDVY